MTPFRARSQSSTQSKQHARGTREGGGVGGASERTPVARSGSSTTRHTARPFPSPRLNVTNCAKKHDDDEEEEEEKEEAWDEERAWVRRPRISPHETQNTRPGTHILMVRSLLPDATRSPAGDQSNAYTSSSWPGSVYSAFPPDSTPERHTLTVLSRDALAMKRLSGDQHTWNTAPTCPVSVTKNLLRRTRPAVQTGQEYEPCECARTTTRSREAVALPDPQPHPSNVLPRSAVPDLDLLVEARARQVSPIRREGDVVHGLLVTRHPRDRVLPRLGGTFEDREGREVRATRRIDASTSGRLHSSAPRTSGSQRNMVKSSEHDTNRSGPSARASSYRFLASTTPAPSRTEQKTPEPGGEGKTRRLHFPCVSPSLDPLRRTARLTRVRVEFSLRGDRHRVDTKRRSLHARASTTASSTASSTTSSSRTRLGIFLCFRLRGLLRLLLRRPGLDARRQRSAQSERPRAAHHIRVQREAVDAVRVALQRPHQLALYATERA